MSKISRRLFNTGIAAASAATLAYPSISLGAVPKAVSYTHLTLPTN